MTDNPDPSPSRPYVYAALAIVALAIGAWHAGTLAKERYQRYLDELAEHLLVSEPRQRRHVVDLRRRVALEMHVGQRVVQRRPRAPRPVRCKESRRPGSGTARQPSPPSVER